MSNPPSTGHVVREALPPGYVPLDFASFRRLRFPKRMMFSDDDLCRELAFQGISAFKAGFCDWIDDESGVQVCVGWAWYLGLGDGCARLAPGGFSSNVMFLRANGCALGPRRTGRMLRAWLATRPWHDELPRGNGYRHCVDRLH